MKEMKKPNVFVAAASATLLLVILSTASAGPTR